MLTVGKRVHKLTGDRIKHIVERNGPVLGRLRDCSTPSKPRKMDGRVRQAAIDWVSGHGSAGTTPNIDHIVGSVRDVLVIQQTQFDDKSLADQERFELCPGFDRLQWASAYVRSLICDAISRA